MLSLSLSFAYRQSGWCTRGPLRPQIHTAHLPDCHSTHTHLSALFHDPEKKSLLCGSPGILLLPLYTTHISSNHRRHRHNISWCGPCYTCFHFTPDYVFFFTPVLLSFILLKALSMPYSAIFFTSLFSSSPDVGAGPDRSCCSLQFVSVKHQLVSEGGCARRFGHSCSSAAAQDFYSLLWNKRDWEGAIL